MTVKIVTDSVADLPPEIVNQFDITVAPILVRFGEDVYLDGIDLTTEQFYQQLRQNEALPVTSVPSPGAFAQVYNRLAEDTGEILAIIVSARLSSTYEVTLQSIGLMPKKCRVEVIDSQLGTMAESFIVMKAAQTAATGARIELVLEVTRKAMT
jgi:DegV family protein with EDD domain